MRIRAARAMGLLDDPQAQDRLLTLLLDPVPGVRRAAAAGLGGHGKPSSLEPLAQRLEEERCVWPLVTVATAWVRCGGAYERARSSLEQAASRTVVTVYGPRKPSTTTETSARQLLHWLARALFPELGPEETPGKGQDARSPRELRADLLARLAAKPHAPPASIVEALALQQHPDDYETLAQLRGEGNRRGETTMLDAFGLHGDPRWLPALTKAIRDVRVAPGRGFAWRRLSAVSLGRIGSPEAAKVIAQALTTEAREFEGKPGAGLGIQYPVRSLLLWALGEIGADHTAPTIADYLGDISGNAMGGFYLPAMGALLKLPASACHATLTARLRSGDDVEAAHALSLLATFEGAQAAEAHRLDPREAVQTVAHALLAEGD